MFNKLKKKSKKTHTISEQVTLNILQRYSAVTVLGMLAEIADNPGEKLDWNKLVNKTSTGISNAREYQMLWRHLAYGDALLDNVEDGAQPLDDDSDLECELEALPNVSAEATSEAAACVKVLASSLRNKAIAQSNLIVEAPLTINVPRAPSDPETSYSSGLMQSKHITIPVYVQKQNGPTTTFTEVPLDRKGPSSCIFPAQRKRKPFSIEEDEALKAVVRKYGEGNWTHIVKENLMEGRTASQLSQRWAILKKKDANLEIPGHDHQHPSEVQQAARHAMSLAINGPKSSKETCINSPVSKNLNNLVSNSNTPAKASLTSISSSQGENQRDKGLLVSTQVVAQKPLVRSHTVPASTVRATSVVAGPRIANTPAKGSLTSINSSLGQNQIDKGQSVSTQVVAKKPLEKSNNVPEVTVRATAVAAGARIATPSDAALLLRAVQSKNAVHIKSSLSRGLAPAPVLNKVALNPDALRPGSVKLVSSTVKPNPSINPTERVRENKPVIPNLKAESRNQVGIVVGSFSSPNLGKAEDDHQAMDIDNKNEKGQSASRK
ncbi:hypothetical protein ACFE04_013133 [Oxalis oulophora]